MRFVHAVTAGVFAVTAIAGTTGGAQAESTPAVKSKVPAAAATFDGYQIVTVPNANVPNFTRRYAYCPTGKRVVGGGGEAQGNEAILVGSFPTADGRGWIALGRQIGYSSVGISVYAICANAT